MGPGPAHPSERPRSAVPQANTRGPPALAAQQAAPAARRAQAPAPASSCPYWAGEGREASTQLWTGELPPQGEQAWDRMKTSTCGQCAGSSAVSRIVFAKMLRTGAGAGRQAERK